MANKKVIIDPYFALASTDYSDEVKSVELSREFEILDQTTSGSSGAREYVPGLKNATITVNAATLADYTGLHAYLESNAGSSVAFEIRPDADAVDTDNPKYTGNCIAQFPGLGLTVGNVHEYSVTLQVTGAVTRATS